MALAQAAQAIAEPVGRREVELAADTHSYACVLAQLSHVEGRQLEAQQGTPIIETTPLARGCKLARRERLGPTGKFVTALGTYLFFLRVCAAPQRRRKAGRDECFRDTHRRIRRLQ